MNTRTQFAPVAFPTTPAWLSNPTPTLETLAARVTALEDVYNEAVAFSTAVSRAVWGNGPACAISWNGVSWEADRNDFYSAEQAAQEAYQAVQEARAEYQQALGWVGATTDDFDRSVAGRARITITRH